MKEELPLPQLDLNKGFHVFILNCTQLKPYFTVEYQIKDDSNRLKT